MLTKPGFLLRAEGAALFVLSLFLYHFVGWGWGLFLLLFLWPDLFMLGYVCLHDSYTLSSGDPFWKQSSSKVVA